MMQCTATSDATEMLFAQAYVSRRLTGACAGPMLILKLCDWRVYKLQRIMASEGANDLLWQGFRSSDHSGSLFSLCAAHWFDLASLTFTQAVASHRVDWISDAQQLLKELCRTARWDAKEVVNMFVWQQQG